jgi:two-component system sensor histidine kinase BaeS
MRSLTWKLTLAFLLVGITGALLVAFLTGIRTRSEFDRFLSSRDRLVVLAALSDYYASHGSWNGVDAALAARPPLNAYRRSTVLIDPAAVVVFGNRDYVVGQQVNAQILNTTTEVLVNGQPVGYVLFTGISSVNGVNGVDILPPNERPQPPENAFLQRIGWAAAGSAGIAALIALLLGTLLARTLTRPIYELTAATHAMASGQLGQRVTVRSRDEIGELATSFNQMSADLARASQLRTQMTADLAHDLRTPLSILRGYTEGLMDGRLQGSPAMYDVMHGEVEHLQRLVEDLRVLSLADSGELPLNRRAVDPMALLERTGLAYFVQAEQHGVTLQVEQPEQSLPSINVDTDRMTQVLNNLVSNALRYTTHGQVKLSATSDGQQVHLIVCDTGVGIPAADLPFIFDRFYRADKSRQRNDTNASGLGLAIAKAIVEAHHGTITVTSMPEQGATFTINLAALSAH